MLRGEQHSEDVNERSRLRDWEDDTVIGNKSPYALVTLVERKSRFTLVKRINRRTAEATRNAVLQMLKPYRPKALTITCDNGREFAAHPEIAGELDAEVYFYSPYASWELGTNENNNSLISQYFSKVRKILGWSPSLGFEDLIRSMVDSDLQDLTPENQSKGTEGRVS